MTAMAEEPSLQFKGLNVTDNSTDEITEVESVGLNQDSMDDVLNASIPGNQVASNGLVYSTDEKVVGIWIDGKPLYQKTINLTNPTWVSPSSGNRNPCTSYTQIGATVGTIVSMDTMMLSNTSGGYFPIASYMVQGNILNPLSSVPTSLDEIAMVRAVGFNNSASATNQNSISLIANTRSYCEDFSYFTTIRYTKTTDTAGSATTTPGAYDINFPNTWPENTEIYFGNGLYGYRATGTANVTTSLTEIVLNASIKNSNAEFVNCGGNIKRSAVASGASDLLPNTTHTNVSYNITLEANGLCMYAQENGTKNNIPYDVWVSYTR